MWALIPLLSAIYLGLHWDSANSMIELWDRSAYQHCFLIPAVSLYLFWDRRKLNLSDAWSGSYFGGIIMLVTMLGMFAAKTSLIQLFEHFFLISGLVAFLWCIAGDKFLTRNWFPLLFLFFCLPAGDTLIPVLQRITADLCALGLSLLDIAAYREGMMLHLAAGQFEVARACSGFRYLNAGLALGALLAYMYFRTLASMGAYIVFVALVFVLMNGFRAFITILIAALSDMQYMTGEDHIVFGYFLFVLAIGGVYWVARRFQTKEQTHA